MATIRDVAKHAGVAISTVSAVINRSAPVSEDAIERVNSAVLATGYTPNGAARSLRSGKTRFVGLVVPNIANSYFAAMAREVENACLVAGYTSVVYSTGQDAAREEQILTMMRLQRVAGLILVPTRSDAAHGAALIAQISVPTVLLDMHVEGLPFDVVRSDNAAAGRIAAEHLIDLGHTRIGMIDGIGGLATSDDRHRGYAEALASRGIAADPALTGNGNFNIADSLSAAHDQLALADPPTAIIAASNQTTQGLLLAVRERGLSVPRQLSVVGIDDLELANLLDPPLTVVATPVLELARHSITRLFEIIGSKRSGKGVLRVLSPHLIVRRSTAAPPGKS